MLSNVCIGLNRHKKLAICGECPSGIQQSFTVTVTTTTTTSMVLDVPVPKMFSVQKDPSSMALVEKWLSSFEVYLRATGVTKEDQKAALILHITGLEVQDIFTTLKPEISPRYTVVLYPVNSQLRYLEITTLNSIHGKKNSQIRYPLISSESAQRGGPGVMTSSTPHLPSTHSTDF
ncbi:hypothetical protein E2C01_100593 [Portunus trituberculatus]|uniref:Uncharacterized protein n=1 Tax=Portunus trituberculatus TaxID=210409 RepID=A0A5B7K3I8_PORTR|nr:hypothetical protein [Portunus trituberculatus]